MITVIVIAATAMIGVVSFIALASRFGEIELSVTTGILLAASMIFMIAGLLGVLLFRAQ